jgi:protein-tyrosine phosphatase
MRVLYVCTANICRSASAERLLREATAADPALSMIEVRSAGTRAIDGAPGCSLAPALAGHAAEHQSTPLTGELVAWADVILAAARDHRSAIVILDPTARARTFTIRQAGRIAAWVLEAGIVDAGRERGAAEASGTAAGWAVQFGPGDPRADVPALPADPDDRWRWLVGELDASRGMAPMRTSGTRHVSPMDGANQAVTADDGTARSQTAGPGTAGASAPPQDGGPSSVSGHRAPDSASAGASLGRWLRRFPLVASRGTLGIGESDDIRDPDDVPDPHVLGAGLHAVAYEQLRESTDALIQLLKEVVR